ncbi:hypothetical protein [Streptomyces sp. NPDC006270]|uniref:hypothetical protein n=1 Tax=Streptomyces sp. NPDC006270 TaxID=3364741 RepID=UPI0036AAD4B6
MSGIRNAMFALSGDPPAEPFGALDVRAAVTVIAITDKAATNDLTERYFTGISRSSGGEPSFASNEHRKC